MKYHGLRLRPRAISGPAAMEQQGTVLLKAVLGRIGVRYTGYLERKPEVESGSEIGYM